jgi:hypothetical protein
MTNKKTSNQVITITDTELLKVVEEYQSYKNLIDEATAIVKELGAKITEAVENSGTNTINVGCHKVSLSKYTRESVSAKDVKALVSTEVFEKLVCRTLTTRLTVK